MAKAKEKLGAFDVRCTEGLSGRWGWIIDGVKWTWYESQGLNVFVKLPDRKEQALVFCASLRDATMYSQGWMGGWYARENYAAAQQRAADAGR